MQGRREVVLKVHERQDPQTSSSVRRLLPAPAFPFCACSSSGWIVGGAWKAKEADVLLPEPIQNSIFFKITPIDNFLVADIIVLTLGSHE